MFQIRFESSFGILGYQSLGQEHEEVRSTGLLLRREPRSRGHPAGGRPLGLHLLRQRSRGRASTRRLLTQQLTARPLSPLYNLDVN